MWFHWVFRSVHNRNGSLLKLNILNRFDYQIRWNWSLLFLNQSCHWWKTIGSKPYISLTHLDHLSIHHLLILVRIDWLLLLLIFIILSTKSITKHLLHLSLGLSPNLPLIHWYLGCCCLGCWLHLNSWFNVFILLLQLSNILGQRDLLLTRKFVKGRYWKSYFLTLHWFSNNFFMFNLCLSLVDQCWLDRTSSG